MDREVAGISQSAPFLMFTGMPGEENAQFYVCCEQSALLESKTVADAVIDLLAAYFVFDISYPKHISAVLLFFQHCVFGLKDSQTFPQSASKLVSNLSKV